MTVRFKKGVRLSGLQPEMLHAIDVANDVYKTYDKDCIVTSARGDKHSKHSHHYKGLAVDFRTHHLTAAEKIKVDAGLQAVLGNEYQVILEATHIHVEYDPEGPSS